MAEGVNERLPKGVLGICGHRHANQSVHPFALDLARTETKEQSVQAIEKRQNKIFAHSPVCSGEIFEHRAGPGKLPSDDVPFPDRKEPRHGGRYAVPRFLNESQRLVEFRVLQSRNSFFSTFLPNEITQSVSLHGIEIVRGCSRKSHGRVIEPANLGESRNELRRIERKSPRSFADGESSLQNLSGARCDDSRGLRNADRQNHFAADFVALYGNHHRRLRVRRNEGGNLLRIALIRLHAA